LIKLVGDLRADPAVATAELVAIDWKKEADVIRANSGK
jgi:hypothetical protein